LTIELTGTVTSNRRLGGGETQRNTFSSLVCDEEMVHWHLFKQIFVIFTLFIFKNLYLTSGIKASIGYWQHKSQADKSLDCLVSMMCHQTTHCAGISTNSSSSYLHHSRATLVQVTSNRNTFVSISDSSSQFFVEFHQMAATVCSLESKC